MERLVFGILDRINVDLKTHINRLETRFVAVLPVFWCAAEAAAFARSPARFHVAACTHLPLACAFVAEKPPR